MGLFENVKALSQNRSNKIDVFTFDNVQNSQPNWVTAGFHSFFVYLLPLANKKDFISENNLICVMAVSKAPFYLLIIGLVEVVYSCHSIIV